jgi:hypothetical protein
MLMARSVSSIFNWESIPDRNLRHRHHLPNMGPVIRIPRDDHASWFVKGASPAWDIIWRMIVYLAARETSMPISLLLFGFEERVSVGVMKTFLHPTLPQRIGLDFVAGCVSTLMEMKSTPTRKMLYQCVVSLWTVPYILSFHLMPSTIATDREFTSVTQ